MPIYAYLPRFVCAFTEYKRGFNVFVPTPALLSYNRIIAYIRHSCIYAFTTNQDCLDSYFRMIQLDHWVLLKVDRLALFLWLFPSCRVAGMTDALSSPHRPVRLLARSQSSTFQISLTRVFPSCFRSSSLPFPWYIRPQHFPQCVFAIALHHMPVPVQSSLGDLFVSLRHSVVPRMCSFLILYLRVTPPIHRSILISVTSILFSCLFRCSPRFCPI